MLFRPDLKKKKKDPSWLTGRKTSIYPPPPPIEFGWLPKTLSGLTSTSPLDFHRRFAQNLMTQCALNGKQWPVTIIIYSPMIQKFIPCLYGTDLTVYECTVVSVAIANIWSEVPRGNWPFTNSKENNDDSASSKFSETHFSILYLQKAR